MSRSRRLNDLMNYFLPQWVDFEMMQIDDYIDEQERQFELQGKSLKDKFHQLQKDIEAGQVDAPPEYQNHLTSSLIDDIWQIDNHFKQFFRQSIVIQLYSFLEYKLKYGCDNYARQKNTAYKMSDMKGSSDMVKAKLFMSRSMGIAVKDLDPEWSYVQRLRKTRNILVHHNGELMSTHRDFKEIKAFEQKGFKLDYKTTQHTDSNKPQRYIIKFTDKAFLNNLSINIASLLNKIGKQPLE